MIELDASPPNLGRDDVRGVHDPMSTGKKYWSGQNCPDSATYGQHHDTNGAYAGAQYDRSVKSGDPFPPSLNNHHFKQK